VNAALAMLLTDTVTHYASTGVDSYGMPTHGAGVARPARLEYRTQQVRTAQGQEVVSTSTLFLLPSPPVALGDKIVLEDGTAPTITEVRAIKDEVGMLDHYELVL
jgi:hypothetical protein